MLPLAFSLDHVGALTRTVRDNALMLDLIAGYDPLDPGSVNRATGGYTADLGRGVKGLRVGVIRHFYARDMQADPEMTAGIDAAVAKLAELGAIVREIETAPLARMARLQPHHSDERGLRDPREVDARAPAGLRRARARAADGRRLRARGRLRQRDARCAAR